MIVDKFLISAGEAKDQEDLDYLNYVANSKVSSLFDFNKYYWVNPLVRYKIVKEYEDAIKESKLLSPEEQIEFADLKLRFIENQLEEEHQFLMQLKSRELDEYIARYHYESKFISMNYNIKVYDFQVDGSGYKEYDELTDEYLGENNKTFSKVKMVSTILTILVAIILALFVITGMPTVSILVLSIALVVAIFQDIKVGRLYRKGFKDELSV